MSLVFTRTLWGSGKQSDPHKSGSDQLRTGHHLRWDMDRSMAPDNKLRGLLQSNVPCFGKDKYHRRIRLGNQSYNFPASFRDRETC